MADSINAEVIAVFPNRVKISVDKLEDFKVAEQSLKVGSYLRIADNEDSILIAIIENFSIEVRDDGERKHIIEANPIGLLKGDEFIRGGDSIAIPPKKVEPARFDEIKKIYEKSINEKQRLCFSALSSNTDIRIPIDGNKFFSKHIAIVGSTGAGKSHTLTKVLQTALNEKSGDFSLNNSHIVLFDIHSEYKSAFPDANHLDSANLILPYWLLNSDELEEILLDTGERDNYNQTSIFRKLVTENKRKHNPELENIFYDSPIYFDITEVENALHNFKNETKNYKSPDRYMIVDESYTLSDGKTTTESGISLSEDEKIEKYFAEKHKFHPPKGSNVSKGDYADGSLEKFVTRLSEKINQDRLKFLFGDKSKEVGFEETLATLMGYVKERNSNITVVDLSGVPFEVLSIAVSLMSRLLFEYGYYYKRLRCDKNPEEKINNDIPLLLVFEEAHKYVPNNNLAKFRASRNSIERIAKEGRKYGVTLLLASQRPSEISETIFSQCNNFIAMRLTNPNDQNYVKKLLPDTLGNLIDTMPSLRAGEALLIGDSIVLPSIVQIDRCSPTPSSNDIPYWELWKEEWKDLDVKEIRAEWVK